jgi:hypothetical protein
VVNNSASHIPKKITANIKRIHEYYQNIKVVRANCCYEVAAASAQPFPV